jgi:hypothetical protein
LEKGARERESERKREKERKKKKKEKEKKEAVVVGEQTTPTIAIEHRILPSLTSRGIRALKRSTNCSSIAACGTMRFWPLMAESSAAGGTCERFGVCMYMYVCVCVSA